MTDVQARGRKDSPRLAEGPDFDFIQMKRREENAGQQQQLRFTGAALPGHREDRPTATSAGIAALIQKETKRCREAGGSSGGQDRPLQRGPR